MGYRARERSGFKREIKKILSFSATAGNISATSKQKKSVGGGIWEQQGNY
jgi:hypothetical protein